MNLHILDTTDGFSIYISDEYSYFCYYCIQKDEHVCYVSDAGIMETSREKRWGVGGGGG